MESKDPPPNLLHYLAVYLETIINVTKTYTQSIQYLIDIWTQNLQNAK